MHFDLMSLCIFGLKYIGVDILQLGLNLLQQPKRHRAAVSESSGGGGVGVGGGVDRAAQGRQAEARVLTADKGVSVSTR